MQVILASDLNRWAGEGFDMMEVSHGYALERLLEDYLTCQSSLPNSMSKKMKLTALASS